MRRAVSSPPIPLRCAWPHSLEAAGWGPPSFPSTLAPAWRLFPLLFSPSTFHDFSAEVNKVIQAQDCCAVIVCWGQWKKDWCGVHDTDISRQAVRDWAVPNGCKGLVLHLLLDAIPFWEKQGFVEVENILLRFFWARRRVEAKYHIVREWGPPSESLLDLEKVCD